MIQNLLDSSGIYVILNIAEWRAYIGKTVRFKERTHYYELANGSDNPNLQRDYDNTDDDFTYMVLCYDVEKEKLTYAEELYMELLEDFGFNLYNESRKEIEKDENFYNAAKQEFITDFSLRFNKFPWELKKACVSERKKALDLYVKKRCSGTSSPFKFDILFPGRQRIKNILGTQSQQFYSLDEFFVSLAGNYLDDGIDRILTYEKESITNNGYCLWTFANNAICYETIKKRCIERSKKGQENIVIFTYTPSTIYLNEPLIKYPRLPKEYARNFSSEELEFINFQRDNSGDYFVPNNIDCTGTESASVRAFVITELNFLGDVVLDYSKLYKHYKAVRADELGEINSCTQRTTHYIQNQDTIENQRDIFVPSEHRTFCFVGKLSAPYIIPLFPAKV